MSRMLLCIKLKEENAGMSAPPFPGDLGLKIYNEVSKKAWSLWLTHQTMLINEYRLNLSEPKSREFLSKEMLRFFFGEGSEKPSGFVEPQF